MRQSRGFTLIELVIASALLLTVSAIAVRQIPAAAVSVDRQAETVDMQQRGRAAIDALRRDLGRAGAGSANLVDRIGLNAWMPPIWPMRLGWRGADPPGQVRDDTLTVFAALPLPSVAAVTSHPLPARSSSLRIDPVPGCPPLSSVCGLVADTEVVVADGEGAFDLFTVTEVTPPTMWLRHNQPDSERVYPTGSAVIPVIGHTYFLRPAAAGRPPQLMKYDGADGADVPVVDHVVSFAIEYFGEGEPPRMRQPLSAPRGPWTTYGPRPPAVDAAAVPVVAGTNCLFAATGEPLAVPVLPALGSLDGPLVAMPPAQLADGPWCPDATADPAYDADLWRIRSLVVTLRVESALDALRGPAGVLFARPGSAASSDRYAPDLELRVRITPANLAGRR